MTALVTHSGPRYHVRTAQQKRILEALWMHGPLSWPDLCKFTFAASVVKRALKGWHEVEKYTDPQGAVLYRAMITRAQNNKQRGLMLMPDETTTITETPEGDATPPEAPTPQPDADGNEPPAPEPVQPAQERTGETPPPVAEEPRAPEEDKPNRMFWRCMQVVHIKAVKAQYELKQVSSTLANAGIDACYPAEAVKALVAESQCLGAIRRLLEETEESVDDILGTVEDMVMTLHLYKKKYGPPITPATLPDRATATRINYTPPPPPRRKPSSAPSGGMSS